MFITYSIIFTAYLILRHYSFHSEYYDLGLQLYSLNSAKTNFAKITPLILPTNDSLIGHLNPIMLVVSLFYNIWSDPTNLFLLTTLAMGASVFPLYYLANHNLKNRKIALIICAIYLINPLFHNSNRYDFHTINFVPLLVISALYLYEKRNLLGFISLTLLANATHEFTALITSSMALSLLIKEYKNRHLETPATDIRKKTIIATISILVIGLVWFLSASIMQAYFDPRTPVTNWAFVGISSTSYIGEKTNYVLQMFTPLLFLPLLEITWILPVMPYTLFMFISNHSGYWSIFFQYGAFTTPFLFYALILALKKIRNRYSFSTKITLRKLAFLLLISNLISAIGYSCISPLSQINSSSTSTNTVLSNHDATVRSIIEEIPNTSSILTHSQIYPHLADRSNIALYYSNITLEGRVVDYYPDFLVFDVTARSFYEATRLFGFPENQTLSLSKTVSNLITEGNYTNYWAADGAYVLSRDDRNLSTIENPKTILLDVDEEWNIRGTYQKIPYGMDIQGSEGFGAFFYAPQVIENNSYSLSYGMKTTKSYGVDSWGGIIFGYKDEHNYMGVILRYPSGFISLLQVKNGDSEDTVIGSIPYPSNDYQYFYFTIDGDVLQVNANSYSITNLNLNSSDFTGKVGFASWQQDSSVHLMLFTER